jgi:hypothetical protein
MERCDIPWGPLLDISIPVIVSDGERESDPTGTHGGHFGQALA